jgi:hypothetical protein
MMRSQPVPARVATARFGSLTLLAGLLMAAVAGAAFSLAPTSRPGPPAPIMHPMTRAAFLAFKEAQAEAREGVVMIRLPAAVTAAGRLALKEARMEAATLAVTRALAQPVTAAGRLVLKEARMEAATRP